MLKIRKNIGEIDKVARAVLGIGFLAAYAGKYAPGAWGYAALGLGLVMIATAAYGACPLYALLGISTQGKPGKKE